MLIDNLRRLARHDHSDHSVADEAADRIVELEGLLGAANNALGHQASLLSSKDRALAEAQAKAKRWQQIADQRAIEVADLKHKLSKASRDD
jgi:hypothetical protein